MIHAHLRAGDGLAQAGVFLARGVEFAPARHQFVDTLPRRAPGRRAIAGIRQRAARAPAGGIARRDFVLRLFQAPVAVGDLGRQATRHFALGALSLGDSAGVAAISRRRICDIMWISP